jgi:uncharacterized FlaG/YvyC family protein
VADHLTQALSLASGSSPALSYMVKAQAEPEKPRPAKVADPQPIRPGGTRLEKAPSPQTLDTALNEIREHMNLVTPELHVQVDKGTGYTYFQIISPKTGEVILQVPAEEVLTAARKLRELGNKKAASGVLLDKEG